VVRVAVIGGGSTQWAPTLVTDLLSMPGLVERGLDIVLEDVDAARLARTHRFAEAAAERARLAARAGPVRVGATTDQGEALEGADFVVVTISTGGFNSMRHDLEVPARHGVRQPVGDTVGPGGISRALRNVPVLRAIAADVSARCPDAWLLNIANPMSCLTRAAHSAHPRTVGLCHEVSLFLIDAALVLGRRVEEFTVTVGGVNHLPVVTRMAVAGENAFPLLLAAADEGRAGDDTGRYPDQPWRSKTSFARRHRVKLWLLERFGALPAAGDRHVVEFFPHFLGEESGWGAAWGIEHTTIAEREADEAGFVARIERQLAGAEPIPHWQSGEMAVPVIDSLVNGTRRELPLNLPNAGQVAGLPDGPVVESICVADGSGIRPRDTVVLPPPFDEWVRRHVAVQELTFAAALAGDRQLALAAMFLDPLSGRCDASAVEAMLDELLAATAEWLPAFPSANSRQ
jgi:alpha-galactosidase/6-phospho-beta-glucosidase family protein